jgi:hypothetical protein
VLKKYLCRCGNIFTSAVAGCRATLATSAPGFDTALGIAAVQNFHDHRSIKIIIFAP